MLGAILEIFGLVGAVTGGVVWIRHARGSRRLLAVVPGLVYLAAQAFAHAGIMDFPTAYPVSLALMAVAGLAGLVMIARPPRSDPQP